VDTWGVAEGENINRELGVASIIDKVREARLYPREMFLQSIVKSVHFSAFSRNTEQICIINVLIFLSYISLYSPIGYLRHSKRS